MKKDIGKRFSDFKLRHSLSNSIIAQMVTEYATSSLDFARSFYSEKYNISKKAFYQARDYAVIFCLVDQNIFKKLQTKSAANCSKNNAQNSARSSLAHHQKLLEDRKAFLSSFSASDIKDIASKYMADVTPKKIAIAYDTGEFAIKYLLKKGIVSLILDADTVRAIHKKVAGNGLDKILQNREYNKRRLLSCLQSQITFLKAQIDCYDLYFRAKDNKPSLESLQSELSKIIQLHKETLSL